MITRFALVLSAPDRSAVVQSFGPYDTRAAAEHARTVLEAMPAIGPGVWDVVPCTDLGHPVPAPITPYSPITIQPCSERRWWQSPIITCDVVSV